MTRNSKKFQKQKDQTHKVPKPKPAPPKPQDDSRPRPDDNPFGLSFVVPTEFVKLPSRGKYYPVNNPFHGVEEVEIRHMTARDEDLISGVAVSNTERVFDKLIDNLLVNKELKSGLLYDEDRTALLLQARATGYGQEYEGKDYCTECKELVKFSFDLSKTTFVDPDEKKSEYDPRTDSFLITLPVSEVKVEIKNLSDEDAEFLGTERKQKEKHKLEYNSTVSLLNHIIISANDVTDPKMIRRLVDVLPAADAKILKNFYGNCRPKISTIQDVECPSCGALNRKEAPISWALFWVDL